MLPPLHLCPIGTTLTELPKDLKDRILDILVKTIDDPCDSLADLLAIDNSGKLFENESILRSTMEALRETGLQLGPGKLADPAELFAICDGLQKIDEFFRETNLLVGVPPGMLGPTARFEEMLAQDAGLDMQNVRDYILIQFPKKVLRSPTQVFEEVKRHFRGEFAHKSRVIRRYPDAFKFLTEDDRDKHDLVLEAVTGNGLMLQHASDRLRNDMEVVSLAVNREATAIAYAGPLIDKTEPEWKALVLSAVKRYRGALRCAGESLQDDYEVVLAAVTKDRVALQFASDRLQGHFGSSGTESQP